MSLSRRQAAEKLKNHFSAIEKLSDQTAAHRKKIEYTVKQLQDFLESYAESATDDPISEAENNAIDNILSRFKEIEVVIGQYIIKDWTTPTVLNPIELIVEQLKSMLSDIKISIKTINPELEDIIELDSQNWMRQDTIDLQAIKASFHQFLNSGNPSQDVIQLVEKRLESINEVLTKNSTKQSVSSVDFTLVPITYKNWLVNMEDFKIIKLIGTGLSADVYLAIDNRTNTKVAIKEFKEQNMSGTRLQFFQREVAVLAALSQSYHPTLLKFIGATGTPPFSIITEFMPHGSLYQELLERHRFSATMKTIAAYDIARGMEYIHSFSIVHRDLKSLNILLDENDRIRICDFGFSRHCDEAQHQSKTIGTPPWMAPELLLGSKTFTSKIDVYSYGILLSEIATCRKPYFGMSKTNLFYRIAKQGLRPELPDDLNPLMRDLITQCWDEDPNVRPPFHEIVQRFQNLEVMFNGTDVDKFIEYMRNEEMRGDQIKQKIGETINQLKSNVITLDSAVGILRKTAIPESQLELMWDVVNQFRYGTDYSGFSRYLLLFFSKSKMVEATEILKTLPQNTIPAHVMTEIISWLPTDSEIADQNITITACHNNFAEICALYLKESKSLALTFSFLSHVGIKSQYQNPIYERCIHVLDANDPDVIIEALRLLMIYKAINWVSTAMFENLIKMQNAQISDVLYMALGAAGLQGLVFNRLIINHLLGNWKTDERVSFPIVAACMSEETAGLILDFIEKEKIEVTELVLKALLCAAKFGKFHEQLQRIIEQNELTSEISKRNNDNLEYLKKLLSK